MSFGLVFRWGSLWVGGHWSPENKRLCVNLIPFVTFWFTLPGGVLPQQGKSLFVVRL